jgi:hypothetical protein
VTTAARPVNATLAETWASARARFGHALIEHLAAPSEPESWIRALFPRHIGPMAPRHRARWRWAWDMEPESSPDPFVGVWPRGGGKSTSAETGTTALGLRGRRRYALYVRSTQERADDSVSNIAALLESETVGRYYPAHADRKLGKHGNSRGWRRNRVWTAGGFIVDAIGLDTASRGVKLEEQRPDLIVLDDIDEKLDTAATTAKKIAIITTSLLPAGATNAAILAIQNLIIPDGFFTRLVDGRADYLARRIVSGPFPAIEGLETVADRDAETGITRHVITAGRATWEGQSLEICQKQIDEWGLGAFRKEAQHEVLSRAEGLALQLDESHRETLSEEAARALVKQGQPFGGIDFGAWRFAFVLRVPDAFGRARQIAEYFNQRGSLEHRATAITAICRHYGVPDGTCFVGDAANPTDIMELNLAFQRLGSPYRVVAVAQANKARQTSVARLNDLAGRGALTYRRDVHRAVAAILADTFKRTASAFLTWRMGLGAGGEGVEMAEPRLWWETQHWTYPVPKEGEAQKQDPDDHSADGADAIAADRYGIMTWWTAAHAPARQRTSEHEHPGFRESAGGIVRADRVQPPTHRPGVLPPPMRVRPYHAR